VSIHKCGAALPARLREFCSVLILDFGAVFEDENEDEDEDEGDNARANQVCSLDFRETSRLSREDSQSLTAPGVS
jgi:hypothetical protein